MNYSEEFVQKIWQHQLIREDDLRLTNGYRLQVKSPGQWNEEDGPDFMNAKLYINSIEVVGDVEIHLFPQGWHDHQHHLDPRYNRVVLHVVLWDDEYAPDLRRQDGRILSTLVLSNFLSQPIGKLIPIVEDSSQQTFPCRQLDLSSLLEIVETAGEYRWQAKAQAFMRRVGVLSWQDVLYEGIMEALGYSKNRWQFLELAQKVPLTSIRQLCIDVMDVQALLFGVSGLLPVASADDDAYLFELRDRWHQLQSKLDVIPLTADFWQFARQRPANFPTVRLAAASYLLAKHRSRDLFVTIQQIFDAVSPGRSAFKQLYLALDDLFHVEDTDYWMTHYTFNGKPHTPSRRLIGAHRQRELVVNILLPIFYGWAQLEGDRLRQEKLMWLYRYHPPLGKNSITEYQVEQMGIDFKVIDSASKEQGLIYIYKKTCFYLHCSQCIFNKRPL